MREGHTVGGWERVKKKGETRTYRLFGRSVGRSGGEGRGGGRGAILSPAALQSVYGRLRPTTLRKKKFLAPFSFYLNSFIFNRRELVNSYFC